VLCWTFVNDQKSVARIKPQYAENLGLQIIGRPKQGPMSRASQCHSLIAFYSCHRGNAPRSDPSSPARARNGRRRMFQQRRPHLGGNIAARMWLRSCKPSKPTHRGAQQQSLASISLRYSAPTSAFAAESGEREDIAGGGRSVITIGGQIAGSSEVDCFGH
jgi:hypothetical protein